MSFDQADPSGFKPRSPRSVGDEFLREMSINKSSIDSDRERAAAMKALKLLDENYAGVKHQAAPKSRPTTARQAAAARYAVKQRKNIVKEIERNRLPPKLVANKKLEKMATSNRMEKNASEKNYEFESVSEMKSQLEIDQQKVAESRALKLMEALENSTV